MDRDRLIEHPRAFALALSVTILCVALFVAMIVFTVLAPDPAPETGAYGLGGSLGSLISFVPLLAFVFVGGLLASRRPRNAIGWICLASGVCWTLTFFNDSYRAYGHKVLGYPPPLSDWINLVGWVPAVGLLGTFLLLLFPTGRLPSRRWKLVAWLIGAVIAVLHFATTFGPSDPSGSIVDVPDVFAGARPLATALSPLIVLLPVSVATSAGSLIVRYRRAKEVDRERIRWIAYAGLVVALTYAVTVPFSIAFDRPGRVVPMFVQLLQTGTLMSYAAVPIAVGVAILRYRLFAIDRLISRTLAHAIVTVLLGGIFVAVVLVPTSILGLAQQPDWVVALATLVVVALFRPLRNRVQDAVNRRFNRSRYDAGRTMEQFAARLRDHVDVDTLGAELCDVVSRTMQPAQVSIWIRRRQR